jgi:hypothetical protein
MAPLIRVAVHHRAARRERLGVAAKVEMEALVLARPGVLMRENPYAIALWFWQKRHHALDHYSA